MRDLPYLLLFRNRLRGAGRGEWPSGLKRQTVNLLEVFYVGSNPASPNTNQFLVARKRLASEADILWSCVFFRVRFNGRAMALFARGVFYPFHLVLPILSMIYQTGEEKKIDRVRQGVDERLNATGRAAYYY